MFEKIVELIQGVPTVEQAAPKLIDAGYIATFHSGSVLRIELEDTHLMVIQLWGNKVLVRGLDSKGKPREVTTNAGR